MTFWTRELAVCLAVLLGAAGCFSNVPRYIVTPAKGQTDQQMNNDQFDCNLQAQKQTAYNPDKSLTEGALVGLLVGGAAEPSVSAPTRTPMASPRPERNHVATIFIAGG